MSIVREIQAEIEKLIADEKCQLEDWFAEMQADAWDSQIDADIKAGRLDHLIARAESDLSAGKTRPLNEVLDND